MGKLTAPNPLIVLPHYIPFAQGTLLTWTAVLSMNGATVGMDE
jgi:hypothetical protein